MRLFHHVPAAALCLLLAAGPSSLQAQTGAATAKQSAPSVSGAWVRLPTVGGRPAGGYLLVEGTGRADALVGVSSPRAERVELHSMTNSDGVMKMRQEQSLAVPATGKLALAPGGNHLMLFGLSSDVKPGMKVPLTLTFQSGAKRMVEAEARAPGAMPAAAPANAAEPAHQH